MKTLITLFCLWAGCAWAGPAEDAAQAAEDLRRASALLETVEGRRDRVNALTETIRALENGMAALREGLRRAAIRQTALERSLASRNADIGRLLGTLQMISRAPEPSLLLHPMGPTGTARSGMVLADLTPTLQAEVDQLRSQISEMQRLQDLQLSAQAVLQRGLEDLQTARIDLSKAITNRTELPLRFTEDETRTAVLVATAKTLDAFAAGIATIALDETQLVLPASDELVGTLSPPALGRVLRNFNEADASGIPRPGVIMVTEPAALINAPAAGTVRFQGPLLDYGNVVILEPASDILFIFAGLGEVYAQTGEVVIKGAPLGLMPSGNGGGTDRQDTLYIEVRKDQSPVNPAQWFRF
ncbi:MAG: peptidoglycan DD-metalloendopeptidase family protein [Pseudomonadota bacterium]